MASVRFTLSIDSACSMPSMCCWPIVSGSTTAKSSSWRKRAVAHNPTSNMKLASGAAPVLKLRAAGVAVGIGTDGEKENNNLDMFEEMKFASLLAKFDNQNAAALDSWDVMRMATIEG